MKLTVYEAPVTELFRVELEGALMSAAADVKKPKEDYGRIDAHEVNTDFSADFSSGWDE